MRVEFGVLGPVEVRLDGEPIPVGRRQQAILALLLVEADRLVTLDQILDRVWGEGRPARPANAVQTQLTLLRRSLAPLPDVTITWQTGAYRLVVDEATIDLHRFRSLVAHARAADDEQAAQHWSAASELWRGEPFAGIDLPWFTTARATLLAEYEAATLDHADTLLRLGQHAQTLPDLQERTTRRPLDERLAAQLMLALHGAGRTADALRHYDDLRERLADELGADPGTPLQELHQRIRTNTAVAPSPGPVPRQLPAAPGSFTGRTDELAAMTKILDNATETGGTVIISAIAGTGGIGKTWLTLHWAHQQRDRFPDGQLFVDLRGFSPESQPLPASAAMSGFLDAIGVPADRAPSSLDAQAALWRTLIADKRMLIVMDNAANTEQVLPLLPGGSTNTVLVNSRDRLAGLATGHGAHRVVLDILTDADARDLLATRLGAERLAAEPDAVEELLVHCGGFPLALSIITGNALSHPDFPLATLAAELRDQRLLALDDTEPTASLPTVLSWSYTALTTEQARAFGLLGIAPGPDIDAAAAADLIDRSPFETRGLLRALERASLLRQHVPGRYGMHDLVRAYAREQAGSEAEPALRRIIDFYLHSAYAADATIYPIRASITLAPAVAGTHPRTFDQLGEAMQWFTEEHQNLIAAHQEAAVRGWDEPTWQLAWTRAIFHWRAGRLLDDLASWRTGLAAALRLGDPAAEALARQHLAIASGRVELFDEAHSLAAESIRIAADIGDQVTQAFSERCAFGVYLLQRRLEDGEPHVRRALALFEKIGHPMWICTELMNLAWIAANRGDYDFARSYATRSLEMRLRHGPDDHTGMAALLDCLGFIANGMGRYHEAIDYYERSRARYALNKEAYGDAETLEHLGHPYRALGQSNKARESWEAALRICRDQHRSTDAQRIEELLDELSGSVE